MIIHQDAEMVKSKMLVCFIFFFKKTQEMVKTDKQQKPVGLDLAGPDRIVIFFIGFIISYTRKNLSRG